MTPLITATVPNTANHNQENFKTMLIKKLSKFFSIMYKDLFSFSKRFEEINFEYSEGNPSIMDTQAGSHVIIKT